MPDRRGEHAHRAKDHEGDLLDVDAAQLGRFWVTADCVNMPAEHRLCGDEIIDPHHDQDDHNCPGQAIIARQHPGDATNDR